MKHTATLLLLSATASLGLMACDTTDPEQTVISAGAEAQELGIAEYVVIEGPTTVARFIGLDGSAIGSMEHSVDGAGVDHLSIWLESTGTVLELVTDASVSPSSQQILVDGQLRLEMIGNEAPELDVDLTDVGEHLFIAGATRLDPGLAQAFGDRSDEIVTYGVCLGAIPRAIACAACATRVWLCGLFSWDVPACLAAPRTATVCEACTSCDTSATP